ncbi:MAG: glycosyltransferase family 2 protein [Anaerolineae bacterium]|nr:glycosyltransferase family 2 protein [Anaerolineae bacterium]
MLDKRMGLSIIIVNWNTRQLLADCLHSVFATVRDIEFEVIVVDNDSTDDSVECVRMLFPQVKLIERSENLGFARGNNVALLEASGEFILLLNPDTILREHAVNRLCQTLRAYPALGAVGSQLLNPDGSFQQSWGHFPSLWTELPLVNRLLSKTQRALALNGDHEESPILAVDWVSGASLMMRRQALEQVGPLDEDYWLYTEEADWCYRVRKANWKIGVVTGAQVIHVARAASRQKYAEALMHFHRSRLLFLLKHHPRAQVHLARGVLCFKAALWMAVPVVSPLAKAYPDLSRADLRATYRKLLADMLVPLDRLLVH